MPEKRIAWSTIWISMIAAIVAAASFTPSSAADDVGSVMAPAGSERAAGWTAERMQKATMRGIADVDPASVKGEVTAMEPAKDPSAGVGKSGDRAGGNLYQKPLFWVGKLFYTTPDGDFQCTAQFISPQVILTAAQCVRDSETGDFYTDFVFALQYKDGKYLKTYGYKCAATKNAWVQPGNERYAFDYATILVDANSASGYFGTHNSYPADAYNEAVLTAYVGGVADGGVIQTFKGPVKVFDDGTVGIKHGSSANFGGAAGGAIVGAYSEGADPNANYVISVDSFAYNDEPGIDYGPYLDDKFKSLWDYTENNCEEP